MAFTFTYTPGDASANSYCSDTYADSYFENFLNVDIWNEQSTERKRKALVMATKQLDLLKFAGVVSTETQALQWPRLPMADRNGNIYTSTEIPDLLQQATCELALELIKNESRYFRDDLQGVDVNSYTAGDITFNVRPNEWDLPIRVVELLKMIGPGIWTNNKSNRQLRL